MGLSGASDNTMLMYLTVDRIVIDGFHWIRWSHPLTAVFGVASGVCLFVWLSFCALVRPCLDGQDLVEE